MEEKEFCLLDEEKVVKNYLFKYTTPFMGLYCYMNQFLSLRPVKGFKGKKICVVVVPKKVFPTAVLRNKVKRKVSEAYRVIIKTMPQDKVFACKIYPTKHIIDQTQEDIIYQINSILKTHV